MGEVIVVDDGSHQRLVTPLRLENDVDVRSVGLLQRCGASAWNAGARVAHAHSDWLVILGDDTCPVNEEFAASLSDWHPSVVAVNPDHFADARSAYPARRLGSVLPESLATRGFAVRRDVFLRVGGFADGLEGPGALLDLAARLMRLGEIAFDPRFQFVRRPSKSPASMNAASLLRQLHNASEALSRLAPPSQRAEHALVVRGLMTSAAANRRRVLMVALREARSTALQGAPEDRESVWNRLTGLESCRNALRSEFAREPYASVAIVEHGRHAWVVRRVLDEMGVRIVDASDRPQALVVGSVSPPQVLDALLRLARGQRPGARSPRIIAPWRPMLPAPAHRLPAAA